MTELDPDWLAEKPEFDRVLDRMRDNQRLPETRDFPGLEERAARLVHQRRGGGRGRMDAAERRPFAGRRPGAARRRTEAVPRGPHRATSPRFGPRHLAAGSRGDVRQSVRGDQRVRQRRAAYLWNRRFLEDWELDEEWLADASAGRRAGSRDGAKAGQPDRRPPRSARWSARPRTSGSRRTGGFR